MSRRLQRESQLEKKRGLRLNSCPNAWVLFRLRGILWLLQLKSIYQDKREHLASWVSTQNEAPQSETSSNDPRAQPAKLPFHFSASASFVQFLLVSSPLSTITTPLYFMALLNPWLLLGLWLSSNSPCLPYVLTARDSEQASSCCQEQSASPGQSSHASRSHRLLPGP